MKRRQWLGLLLALVLTVAFATAAFAADTVEPFTDVPADEYYSEPVAWAVAEKITNGTDDTHFSPAQICTRAQIVTFLYRATVSAAELEGVTVNGIILTADGQKYALRHVEDIWRITSLGWNWDGMDGKGLAGKTITNVTYYIKDADGQYQILSYDVNVAVKQNPGRMSAEVTDANTIKFSGLPSDIQNPVATVTHPDPNGQGQHAPAIVDAENVPVVNGVIALDQPLTEGVAYTVTVTSDNYGDTSASAPYYIPAYVLMNIPYADFYAASGVESVDAVSSSTLSKTRNGNLAGGSYHKNADGTDISGVVYPVYVENRTILSSFKQVTDSDSVTIAVNNHGNVSETTYTGKDALFENEDYAYSLLDKAPNSYKTLSVGRDGSYVFSDASVQAKSGEANVEITYGGHHTDITFKVAADGLDQSSTKVNGVVITADGVQYALRHVYEIWRVTELVWNWDQLDGNGLANKTITNVTYYIQNADGEYEVLSFDVHETLLGNPGEMTAEAKDAKTIVLTGLPKDIQNPVAKVTHPDPNGQGHHSPAIVDAENVSVVDDMITLGEPLSDGVTYTVTVTSDNYGDASASVQLKAAE